ncbi:hypothetical protein GOODEAATRI_029708, partial [Goodea atripinnis]
ARSPLTETCRRTLMGLPVHPGEMFGYAALEALERSAQGSTWRGFIGGGRSARVLCLAHVRVWLCSPLPWGCHLHPLDLLLVLLIRSCLGLLLTLTGGS